MARKYYNLHIKFSVNHKYTLYEENDFFDVLSFCVHIQNRLDDIVVVIAAVVRLEKITIIKH